MKTTDLHQEALTRARAGDTQAALDHFAAYLERHPDNGHAWKKHNVTSDKVLKVNKQIENGSEKIWEFARSLIEGAVKKGDLKER